MTKKQDLALADIDGLTFAHGLAPAFAPMARFCDYLTGRSDEEEPDSEGVALSRDIVLGRAGYGEMALYLCIHLCGKWHVVTRMRVHDRSLATWRSKMITTTPRKRLAEEGRLQLELQRERDIAAAEREAAAVRAARWDRAVEAGKKEWEAIQASRGNL